MNRIKSLVLLLIVATLFSATACAAGAIEVDGYKSPGEWDENWAFGQENATTYDPNGPFGDRLVMRQGGLHTAVTDNWFDVYPNDTAGPTFDQSMATLGDYSGSDIMRIYARYDPVNDVMYGMCEVYGIPGDVDGDGDVTGVAPADQAGNPGPAAGTPGHPYGLGPTEFWSIYLEKNDKYATISIVNNDWSVSSNTALDGQYDEVSARFTFDEYRPPGDTELPKSVYEVSINNFSTYFNMTPGDTFAAQIMAGSSADVVGEDIVSVFITPPNPAIDIEKYTNGIDADEPTGPFIHVGENVTWTYEITNIGDVPLDNVVVMDNVTGLVADIDPADVLFPGETWIFNVTGVAEEGQYANMGNVTALYEGFPVFDEDPSHYFGAAPSIDIEKYTNGIDADEPTGPFIPVGETVTWTYNVTNTGNVDLTNVTVTDNVTGAIFDIGDLAAGESTEVEDTGTALEGQYANIGNVTGEFEGIIVTDEDPSHYFGAAPSIDIEKYTNGEDADTPTGPFIPVGDEVTWTYNVTNTGNVDLTNVTVTDNVTGAIFDIGDLAAGESTEVEDTGTALEGQYANMGNVTGEFEGIIVTDEDPSHYFGAAPSIDIEKYTNGEDADTPTGPFIPVGDEVTWTYNVTNTGNVDLTNVTVTDNVTGAIFDIGDLAAGESTEVEDTGTALEGQYANIGNVTGEFEGIIVTDEDPSHYFGAAPSIDIEKYTNGIDADEPTGPFIPVGDEVTWTYNVTNTGNVDLTNVTVTDNVTGATFNIGDLAAGESTEVEDTGTALEGQYANIGNVTGEFEGIIVTDEDPSHYFGAAPSIDIEKYTNGIDADEPTGPFIPVGETVTWTYNVTNTGTVPLSNVVVTDNVTGQVFNIGNLGVGESTEVEDTGIAVGGQYANMGNVTGEFEGIIVTDEDPSHYFGAAPSIDIEKHTNGVDADSPPGPSINVGDPVTWTYIVTNTGTVPLSNVVVTDNVTGKVFNIGNLGVGESTVVEDTGVAIEGQYVNMGNVTGEYNGIIVTDQDPSHYVGIPEKDVPSATPLLLVTGVGMLVMLFVRREIEK
ncbi:DUF7507 domain-containing protein [Methanosalsum zhilinae]|nr:hypothetical protein [Methanosalsum zhilinae]